MSKIYIAYGSNLNKQQMKGRCPTAKFLGTGIIEDYELQFKGSLHTAHATIAPKEGSQVPVGLWEIRKRDEENLDFYEGHPNYYFKQDVEVQTDGKTVRGMAYIMDLRMDFGNPRQGYYDIVFKGYEVLFCFRDISVKNVAISFSVFFFMKIGIYSCCITFGEPFYSH